MAYVYKTIKKRRDKESGKWVPVLDAKGKQIPHDYFRAEIRMADGERTTVTIPTRNRAEAKRQADLMQLRQDQIRSGDRPSAKQSKPARNIHEVAEEYLRWGECQGGRGGRPWGEIHARNRRHQLNGWRNLLQLKTMNDLQDCLPAVEKECHARLQAGAAGKTVANEVETLKAFILWSITRKYLEANPLEGLGKFDTTPKMIRRVMSHSELTAFMACAPSHLGLLFEVAMCSGLRRKELRSLTPDHVDAERGGLKLDAAWTKNRKGDFQPLPTDLVRRLVEYAATGDAKKQYKLAFRKGAAELMCPDNPLLYVPKSTSTTMHVYLKKAGIPVTTKAGWLDFHVLRVAYINMLIEAGVDPKTLQALARHSTLELTMNVYARTVDDKLRQGVEKVGQMIPNPGSTIISPESGEIRKLNKNATSAEGRGCKENAWCRKQDVARTFFSAP